MSQYRTTFIQAAVAAAGMAIAGCGASPSRTPDPRPVAVRVARPIVTDLESRLSYVGTVHSVREIQVIARIQGTVAALPVPEGGSVQSGDTVAVIDAPDLRAAVDRVRADRDYWHGHHEADLRLAEAGAIPQEQVDVSARAYRSAEASLAEVQTRLGKGVERSPVEGTVLSWIVETGQHVMPGQPMGILGDDHREVRVEVVQEDLERGIRAGTPAVVSVGGGETLPSVITDLSPRTSSPARTFTARVPLPAASTLRWGRATRCDLILESRKACTAVPVEALTSRSAATGVFLVRNNRAVWQEVTRGIEQDATVEVIFPWNGEDLVATSNLGSLEEATPVFPVTAGEAMR